MGALGRPDFPTADLSDLYGDALQACVLPLSPYGAYTAFRGIVSTVRCFEDVAVVRPALSGAGAGKVLVVDGAGSLRAALLGDVLGGIAVRNGWSGVIVHGAVRDVLALRSCALGICAMGTSPRRGGLEGAGERDVPVTFGDATFSPGAKLWCDKDGIVVSVPGGAALGQLPPSSG